MSKTTLYILILTAVFVAGCGDVKPTELNGAAFIAHFSDEERCSDFIYRLVSPAAREMADLHNVQEIRAWLASHPEYLFSKTVLDVQLATREDGVLIPQENADQLKVTESLYVALKKQPGFSESGCGPDVREAVMGALYEGLGGADSMIIKGLERDNIKGPWNQQWTLLTAVMAAHIPVSWGKPFNERR